MLKVPANIENYQSHYSDKKLWDKLRNVAKAAGTKAVYFVLVLYYLLQSPDVSTADKAKIYGALGYFIVPLDLMPDFLPIVGYSDDIGALFWAIHAVWSNLTPDIEAKAKEKLKEWFGEVDEIDLDLNE